MSPMSLETLTVRKDGPVVFAEIAAPPMNLLGPELVRDLVSLIQRAEADDGRQGARVQERRPRLLHLPRRRDQDRRVPGGGGEADRRAVDRAAVSPSQREPARHDRADRGSRPRRRQRVRAGVRHALRRARVGDLQPVRAGVRSDPRRRRRPAPHAPHGPRPGARGHVERATTTTRSWPNGTAGSTARCPPTSSTISSGRSPIGSPGSRPPATSWSRTGSTRSRSRRSRISVAIPISSARACASPRPRAGSQAALKRGFQTRDAEMDLAADAGRARLTVRRYAAARRTASWRQFDLRRHRRCGP